MDPQFVVFLYSKYSPNCKKLLDIIQSYGMKIDSLCIDNDSVRKRILTSKNVSIKIVPCILIGFQDGVIEKYDGDHATEWITKVISNLQTEHSPKPQPQYQPPSSSSDVLHPSPQPQRPPQQNRSPPQSTSVSDLEYDEPRQPHPPRQPKNIPPPPEEYYEEPVVEPPQRPGLDQRSVIGGGQNKPKPKKGPNDTSDILTKAQEMQKMRETDEPQQQRNR